MNSDLENLRKWLIANKLSLNVAKTEYILRLQDTLFGVLRKIATARQRRLDSRPQSIMGIERLIPRRGFIDC
jgi:hypothetical protein